MPAFCKNCKAWEKISKDSGRCLYYIVNTFPLHTCGNFDAVDNLGVPLPEESVNNRRNVKTATKKTTKVKIAPKRRSKRK
jgi:hypothetical protein